MTTTRTPTPALLMAASILAFGTWSQEAAAITAVQISYGGTTVTLNDGGGPSPSDQNANPSAVRYSEGTTGNAFFPDFTQLDVDGERCTVCPSRLFLQTEVALGVMTAASDLTVSVSDNGFTLDDTVAWDFFSSFSPLLAGTDAQATFTTYWSDTDSVFARTDQLATDTLSGNIGNFFNTIVAAVDTSAPFSMTIDITFAASDLQGAGTLGAQAALGAQVVPLPASALFLLSGIAGLGFLRMRRTA